MRVDAAFAQTIILRTKVVEIRSHQLHVMQAGRSHGWIERSARHFEQSDGLRPGIVEREAEKAHPQVGGAGLPAVVAWGRAFGWGVLEKRRNLQERLVPRLHFVETAGLEDRLADLERRAGLQGLGLHRHFASVK